MFFYPRTLKRNWYMDDVRESINTSLEGIKRWTQFYYENHIERDAYLEAFSRCQQIVRDNNMRPKDMLKALSDYHDELTSWPKPSFFSLARWFYDPADARNNAVKIAFEVVNGISNKFWP